MRNSAPMSSYHVKLVRLTAPELINGVVYVYHFREMSRVDLWGIYRASGLRGYRWPYVTREQLLTELDAQFNHLNLDYIHQHFFRFISRLPEVPSNLEIRCREPDEDDDEEDEDDEGDEGDDNCGVFNMTGIEQALLTL